MSYNQSRAKIDPSRVYHERDHLQSAESPDALYVEQPTLLSLVNGFNDAQSKRFDILNVRPPFVAGSQYIEIRRRSSLAYLILEAYERSYIWKKATVH